MGAVYGIDIYHKGYSGNSNYHFAYEAFSLKQFDTVLEKAIKGTDYNLVRIKRQRLMFQYSYNAKMKIDAAKETEQFVVKNDPKKRKTTITALFLTPNLYFLIIKLVEVYKLQIHFEGLISVYTPETIHQYKNGDYWFICTINPNEIEVNAIQIATDFLNHNEYWNFNLFIENYGYLYFDNHTDQPLDGYYNITICTFGEKEYNSNITLKESKKLLKRFSHALQQNDKNQISVLFQPKHKSYYDVSIEFEALLKLEDLVQAFFEINIDAHQNDFKCYDVQRFSTQSIKVSEICKNEENEYDELEINEEGLQNGLIYTDKMYNEEVFVFLCTLIATHFCPCSPASEDNSEEKIIYYKLEKDKEILQELYGSHTANLIFRKVVV